MIFILVIDFLNVIQEDLENHKTLTPKSPRLNLWTFDRRLLHSTTTQYWW